MPRLLAAPLATALLTALLVPLGLVQPSPAAAAVQKDWGWTQGTNAVFKKGCQRYTYRYRLTPPTDDWEVELFIVDPRGEKVYAEYLLSDSEPLQGKRVFRMCGSATRPGTFKIRGRMTAHDGWDEVSGRLPKSRFRLRAR